MRKKYENTILITGGAGFIGSGLAEKLAKEPYNRIIIIDNLQTGRLNKIPISRHRNIKFIRCDVNKFRDIGSVFSAYAFDYIFHYAATVGVKRTLDNPVKVLKDISGIQYLLNLSRNSNVKRIFFSSSSEVYGEPVEYPQNEETTPLNSRLPYAVVKNVGEAFVRSFYKEYGLPYTIFRFFNTYGPKQSKDFVVSRFIASALRGEDITIYGDGSQTRTFCYIDDNVDATSNALHRGKFINDVINVGNNVESTILELARVVIKKTKSRSKIVHLPPLEEGDMTRRRPDISKMKMLLRRKFVPLDEGIGKIIRNPEYIL